MQVIEVFDKKDLLDNFDGDEDLLDEIIGVFIRDVPVQIDRLEKAYSENDFVTLALQAHKMKGAAANMRALSMQALFTHLETAAKNDDTAGVNQLMGKVGREFDTFKKIALEGKGK